MIRYTKSPAIRSLLARGVAENAANCAAYDANPAAYRAGGVRFKFKRGVYGASAVKRHLEADQYHKCGFCEAIFNANVAGDVEHYRPKGAVKTGRSKVYPGYYWLGYEWANLSYACPDCNQYRKCDHFPLVQEATRARDHHEDIAAEAPLLLDPYGDRDPRQHIAFRGEAPIAKTREGEATIEILRLDRPKLMRKRLNHLRRLSDYHKTVSLLKDDQRPDAMAHVEYFRAALAAAVEPCAEFSAASADHLSALNAGRSYLPEPSVGPPSRGR